MMLVTCALSRHWSFTAHRPAALCDSLHNRYSQNQGRGWGANRKELSFVLCAQAAKAREVCVSVTSVHSCSLVHPSGNGRLHGISNPILLCSRGLRLNLTYQRCTVGKPTVLQTCSLCRVKWWKVLHFALLLTRAHTATCNHTTENGLELELSFSRMRVSEIIGGR